MHVRHDPAAAEIPELGLAELDLEVLRWCEQGKPFAHLSVERIDESTLRVGVHIAAPALFFERTHALEAIARERLSTSAYAVVCYSTCAVVLAIAAVIARVPLAGFSAKDWLLIAAITFVAQLLGHTLFNLVVSTVGPTIVSLAILLEVPGSLIVALVLLHQAPPLLALPGMAAVVVGVTLVVRASRPTTVVEPGT